MTGRRPFRNSLTFAEFRGTRNATLRYRDRSRRDHLDNLYGCSPLQLNAARSSCALNHVRLESGSPIGSSCTVDIATVVFEERYVYRGILAVPGAGDADTSEVQEKRCTSGRKESKRVGPFHPGLRTLRLLTERMT